jgi:phosphoribosylglycinamide formyltransferase-1
MTDARTKPRSHSAPIRRGWRALDGSSPLRLAVLASGRGSNLQAVLDAVARGELDVALAVVIADREDAPALERARRAGVPAHFLAPGHYRTRLTDDAEARYLECLDRYQVDLVFLAGFMRVLHETFLNGCAGDIINIHPSLLPSFPGLDAQRQALEAGVKITGATVHFVDAGVDQGPIIGQLAVPVLDTDDRDSLADRILASEHRLIVDVLKHFAAGCVRLEGRRVKLEGERVQMSQ